MNHYQCVAADVLFGKNVKLSEFINLYGCEIGDETKIGAFVEVQKNARIGRRCKISSHSFICEGVTIEDNVFVGHGVTFINDSYPRATAPEGSLQTEKDWRIETTLVKRGASIGSGATILSKVVIGENAIVGAGSVVTRDVPPNVIAAGNPAKVLRAIPRQDNRSNRNGHIPFLDLVTPHQELEEELVSVFRSALRSASFVGGSMVEEFEHDFARFCDSQFCIGVGSGTDALRFALIAAGILPGDIVLTVPLTFIATTEAISQAGGRPDFVDIDPRSYTMDPQKLLHYAETQCVVDAGTGRLVQRVSRKPVTAVIPVHLYGRPVDMDPILEIATRFNLMVIRTHARHMERNIFQRKNGVGRKSVRWDEPPLSVFTQARTSEPVGKEVLLPGLTKTLIGKSACSGTMANCASIITRWKDTTADSTRCRRVFFMQSCAVFLNGTRDGAKLLHAIVSFLILPPLPLRCPRIPIGCDPSITFMLFARWIEMDFKNV